MSSSPYINAPLIPARPRMFNSSVARAVWTAVPVVSLGLLAAVPFVVAAVKGVVKPWLAVTYVVGEIMLLGGALAMSPEGDSPVAGFLIIILFVTAATHTALLDNEKVRVGK